jgi:hypothetical protein
MTMWSLEPCELSHWRSVVEKAGLVYIVPCGSRERKWGCFSRAFSRRAGVLTRTHSIMRKGVKRFSYSASASWSQGSLGLPIE